MKLSVVVFFAAMVGVAAGFGVSTYENVGAQYGFSKAFAGSNPKLEITDTTVPSDARPSARVVGAATHDFGSMSLGESREHTFVIENVGTAPLTVAFDAKSCQCTEVEIDKHTVPPGERTNVRIEWKPKKFDLDFRQAAAFRTNDPARPELLLAIRGQVRQNARITPQSIDFGSISKIQSQHAEIYVYGYRDQDFKVLSAQLLDEQNQEKFTVTLRPLTDEELAAEPGALGGAVVAIDLEAGLPMGPFLQHLRIVTNKNDIGPYDVIIAGYVVSDVSVIAPSYFSKELNSFVLGTLSGDKVHEFKFFLLVKNLPVDQTEVSVVDTDPAGILDVRFDPPAKLGNVVRVSGVLTITPTNRPVNRNGSKQAKAGEFTIKTTHPDVPEMKIRVAFSVEAS